MTAKYSLQSSLLGIILILGLTSIVTVLLISSQYKNLVYSNERSAQLELIQLRTKDILNKYNKISRELGLNLQKEAGLRKALQNKNYEEIIKHLNDNFFQYYVTAGIIRLHKIYLFDSDLNYITQSSEGLETPAVLCPQIIEEAKTKSRVELIKNISMLCTTESIPLEAVLIPIDTLSPKGFLLIVYDPSYNLRELETELNVLVQLRALNKKLIYQSNNWEKQIVINENLTVQHTLKNRYDEPILEIAIVKDIENVIKGFESTASLALLIALSIIIPAVLLSYIGLKRTIKPLRELLNAAQQLSKGKFVSLTSNSPFPEIQTLLESFSYMSQQVRENRELLQSQVEEATQSLRQALNLVEQRNIELQNALQEAENASNAKTAFLATMSHELRTPLNGIIGYTELLLENNDNLPLESRTDLETVAVSARHLLNIVDDILDLTRIESDNIAINTKSMDLKEVITTCINIASATARKNGNTVVNTMTETIIHNDDARLKQVFVNLINNAFKFTKNGTVTISCKQIEKDFLEVEIRDTGIGIAEEKIDQLFKPFTQADSSYSRQYEGTGLGLALARKLARKLGGDIVCQSKLGEGSSFRVTIKPNI